MTTSSHLNVFPLGSYSMLLGMDWLYIYRTKVDCYDDDGERIILQGKKKPMIVRMVASMQVKRSSRKGCVLFTIHISIYKRKDVEDAKLLKRVSSFAAVSRCIPSKDFRVTAS